MSVRAKRVLSKALRWLTARPAAVVVLTILTVGGVALWLAQGSAWWVCLAVLGLLGLALFGVQAAQHVKVLDRRGRDDIGAVAASREALQESRRGLDAVATRLSAIEAAYKEATATQLKAQLTLQKAVEQQREEQRSLRRLMFTVLRDSQNLRSMPPGVAAPLAQELFDAGDLLDAHVLLTETGLLADQPERTVVQLARGLYDRGYLGAACSVAAALVDRFGGAGHEDRLARFSGELAVYEDKVHPEIAPPVGYHPRPRRVLHVVGLALPFNQTGYAVRTQYSVLAQREVGLDPQVVVQSSAAIGDLDETATDAVDGIVHFRLAGPAKGTATFDRWFETFVQELASVVRKSRPAVLHAASDFVNARAAELVGAAFGVPVVYESRGFWEESRLSNLIDRFGWTDLDALERIHGLPDKYTLRRDIEDAARREAAAVVTLSPRMVDRVVAGGVPAERVYMVPNAVDLKSFPPTTRDDEFGLSVGIKRGSVVVGYISSLNAYEGIDVLIRGFQEAAEAASRPMQLLIVGDGPVLEPMQQLVKDLGIDDAVVFTGRVPHETVLAYYGLIDIFVVPRKPLPVTHLVTPLKPYEAMATGRAVVLSDVGALRQLAEESRAAVTFKAGDADDLARVITRLVGSPKLRTQLGEAATAWVREHRTWSQNGAAYLRLYRDLGVTEDDTASGAVTRPASRF